MLEISPKRGRLPSGSTATFQPVLRTIFALAALILVLPTAAPAGISRVESSLLREINHTRAAHRLRPLVLDTHLERAAKAHTSDMVRTNVFAHGAFASRLLQFDVAAHIAGENIAWGTGPRGSARSIVAAWLASPEHRANLLGRTFRRVGVGELVAPFQGLAGACVVTADFAG
jgi:uncharacterized protein YkwD